MIQNEFSSRRFSRHVRDLCKHWLMDVLSIYSFWRCSQSSALPPPAKSSSNRIPTETPTFSRTRSSLSRKTPKTTWSRRVSRATTWSLRQSSRRTCRPKKASSLREFASVTRANELEFNQKLSPFSLGTQNGIQIEQVGKLKDDNKTLVVKGSYSYTGADGRRYRVRYTADELGFHPITELELDIPDVDPNAGKRQAPPVTTKTTRSPFSKSDFINKRYLPPSNSYLPPSNEYLPPASDFSRDLEAPFNSI